jgi:CRISPR-associated protein Csh2
MTKENVIQHSSDFLFLYEATQCNPNGDPDQENKPRMDYDTQTNLVTDTRVKRYIRDYLKSKQDDEVIFVDMEGDSKVSVDSKLKAVVGRTITNNTELELAFKDNPESLKIYQKIIAEEKGDPDKVWKAITDKKFKDKEVNYQLLAYLVQQKFIDIRMFGSAFAVGGFTKAYNLIGVIR